MERSSENRQAAGAGDDQQEPEVDPDPSNLSFTLYIRPGASTVTKERQAQIRERFESLEAAAVIDEVTVENWSKEVDVPKDGTATDEDAVELFDEFRQAIEEVPGTGRLEPFFEERPQVSSFFSTSATERVIVFPVLGVTVRREGDLVGLFPCWLDGTHYSVSNCLDLLTDGDSVANLQ